MPTIFTRILEGELPASFVWRDDRCAAFLSIAPLKPGHTLVVPFEEIDHWLDAPPDLMDHLVDVARRIGRAQEHVYRPVKVGLMLAGLEVPHLHLHVVPIWTLHDLDFARAGSAERPELDREAERIRQALEELGLVDER